jgi:hypothetical protein
VSRSTAQLLASLNAVNKAIGLPGAESLPVGKSDDVNTTSTLSAGGQFMNRKAVHGLIVDAADDSGWLGATSMKFVDQRSGEFTDMTMGDWLMEPATEGETQTASNVATTAKIEYTTAKFHGTVFYTPEDVREAAASGEGDFIGKLRKLIAIRLGSNIAQLAINGDTDLASGASTRENRFLGTKDGWLKQIRDAGNVLSTTRGSAYSIAAFQSAYDNLPERYQNDPNLRWMISPMLAANAQYAFASAWASASQVANDALLSRQQAQILGIQPVQVPQMSRTQGFATLNGSTTNADAVTNPSGTIIKLRVDTLLGGAAAGNAGRKIKVTRNSTGLSETRTVTWDGTNNFVSTVGALGQGSISTTASDYTLDIADCASILLTNPRNLVNVIDSSRFRMFNKFEQEADRFRLDFYVEMCPLVYRPEAASIQDGIIVSTTSFGA